MFGKLTFHIAALKFISILFNVRKILYLSKQALISFARLLADELLLFHRRCHIPFDAKTQHGPSESQGGFFFIKIRRANKK